MGYTVLARRYRSQAFGDVVGQEPIAQTLRNAISGGRVAHAYLFTGTRGVGKTSMARLFARALNAPATVSDCPAMDGEAYPGEDVQQRMAEAIMRGDDLNVIEIDGASNRSVEEARQLIAGATLAPTGNARFKIYIIDEVHMLTREAFNTLLKTMEEPPGHVKFVLCTTEPHRVPATIQSRCQRFDFRNIAALKIAEHLKAVVAKEGLEADGDVLWQVAQLGNGSMRDALSLLDRLIASGADSISGDVVTRVLGLPARERLVELTEAFGAGDAAEALGQVSGLLQDGISQDQLVEALMDHLHQLMVVRVCGAETDVIEASAEARGQLGKQAEGFDAGGLVYMIALCENLGRAMRTSGHPRTLLDALVVRLATAEKMADVARLVVEGEGEKKKSGVSEEMAVGAAGEMGGGMAGGIGGGDEGVGVTEDVGVIWERVMGEAGERRATVSWVGMLELISFADGVAKVSPRAGRRSVKGVMGPGQMEQLGQMLGRASGRSVRVEVVESLAGGGADAGGGGEAGVGGGGGGVSQDERAAAMALPLVSELIEEFDATLLGVRREVDENQSGGDVAEAEEDV